MGILYVTVVIQFVIPSECLHVHPNFVNDMPISALPSSWGPSSIGKFDVSPPRSRADLSGGVVTHSVRGSGGAALGLETDPKRSRSPKDEARRVK